MSGSFARRKGHNWERLVAKAIRSIFGNPADEALKLKIKRGLQSRNHQDLVEDVISPIFSIECKAYKANPPIKKAVRQAQETASKNGGIPVAIIKENNVNPYVILSYKDFIGLFSILADLYGKEELLNSDKALLEAINNESNRIETVLADLKKGSGPGTDSSKS